MKVLFTHERFLPDFGGGGELIVYDRVRGMIEHGADVRVLTAGKPTLGDYREVPVKRIGIRRHAMNMAVRAVMREARGVDLIHTFTYNGALPSMIAARLLGIPIVCEFLGLFGSEWLSMKGPVAGRAYRRWERMLLRLPWDRALFLSDFSHADAIAYGADPRRCVTLEPAVDTQQFQPAEKDDYVLFVGKFEHRKGIDDLIAVAHALPNVQFRAIGWTEDFERLRPRISPNLYLQSLPRGSALYEAFAKAPIFLFPSRKETFGLVVREAMAAGCAVISTSELPFRGTKVVAGDTQRMIEGVQMLLNDRSLADRLGRENRELAIAHNLNATLTHQLAIYHEVLSGRRPEADGALREAGQPADTDSGLAKNAKKQASK